MPKGLYFTAVVSFFLSIGKKHVNLQGLPYMLPQIW